LLASVHRQVGLLPPIEKKSIFIDFKNINETGDYIGNFGQQTTIAKGL